MAQAAAKRVAYTLVDRLPAQAGNEGKISLLSISALLRRPCLSPRILALHTTQYMKIITPSDLSCLWLALCHSLRVLSTRGRRWGPWMGCLVASCAAAMWTLGSPWPVTTMNAQPGNRAPELL